MTPTKRSFSLGAILSLTTGKLLCAFGDMHELAEWVSGHPVWTHEFAERATWERFRQAVFAQHPALASVDASAVNRDNCFELLAGWETQFGKSLEIASGSEQRTESPMESLQRIAPWKEVVVVTTGPNPEAN